MGYAQKYLKIDKDTAEKSVDPATAKTGMPKDLRFDLKGFKNRLRWRAEFEGGDPNANPNKYIDLPFYKQAQ